MDFETQLQKRMALAKQQGWNDADIQRSAMVERAVRNQQQQLSQQQAAKTPKKTGGRGGFLTSLISEGGATAGALTGASIGSIVPGLGTLIGGALGGLAGGFLGSGAEQKVRDDKVDWRKAGVEGLFSAVPGGFGKGVNLAAKAGTEGVEQAAKRGLPTSLRDLFSPQPGAITDKLGNMAGDLRGAANGVRTGGRMEGRVQRLQPNEVADTRNFLNEIGAKGTAERQLSTVQQVEQQTRDAINQIVDTTPKPVSHADIIGSLDRVQAKILGENGGGLGAFDPATHGPIATSFANQMAGITDSKGWLNFKRSLDDIINYSRNSQSVDPKIEQIARIFRGEASDHLNQLHPDIVPLNKMYSRAQDAKNVLVLNADPKGIATGVVSVNGRGAGGKTIQRGADSVGRLMERSASVASMPAAGQFGGQLAASGVQDMFGGGQQPVMPAAPDPTTQMLFANPQSTDEQMLNLAGQQGASSFDDFASLFNGGGAQQPGMGAPAGDNADPSQYLQAAMQALAAGDTKSYTTLMGIAGDLQGYQKNAAALAPAGGGGGPGGITKVTAQQYGLAQSGMASLQQLAGMLQSDPGMLSKTAIPGGSLPVVGGFITNAKGTGSYDTLGYNIADAILRLRTGATANASEVKNLQTQIMPRAGDSPQTIQTKLATIQNIFGGVTSLAGSSNTTDPLADLFSQTQGGALQSAYGY
jgi:hypothetical protein